MALLTLAKANAPAIIGALLAVWKRKDGVSFDEMDAMQKTQTLLVALCAIVIGVCIGKWIGGIIALYWSISSTVPNMFIEFVIALNGLKIIDSITKSADASLDILTENVPMLVKRIISNLIEKIDQFFGKK